MPRVFPFLLPLVAFGWLQTSPAPDEIFVDMVQKGAVSLAVRDFTGVDDQSRALASEITEVLRADLDFAAVYRVVTGIADLEVEGETSHRGNELLCRVRIYLGNRREMIFGTEYTTIHSARRLAHRIADDILSKAGQEGIASTLIAFASNRGGDKAIYQMDYDGYQQKPVTRDHFLDLAPRWSPDGRELSFVSYPRKQAAPALALVGPGGTRQLFQGTNMVTSGAFSPDGSRIAFSSSHEGDAEIYVMNRDGSNLRRLTVHPSSDVSPTWSPTGKEIAFTSDRSGSPQIYVMDDEGLNLRRLPLPGSYNAEPAWSPSTKEGFAEIAYASRIEGARFDIVIYNFVTKQARQLTAGRGMNESPSWAPNGGHLVFTSTRSGTSQIFTIHRDGSNLRQVTFDENTTPSWGPVRR
ncbi:MAG TPA: Tol-Pal system beta propeller repeat protein TolB [Vicinamibacteria bacterium]|nr:Tol-Pal system beta propeller repeat protein TolB [Vicinamibacteria bacterium]